MGEVDRQWKRRRALSTKYLFIHFSLILKEKKENTSAEILTSAHTVYEYMNALSHSLIHSHTHSHTRVPGLQDKRGECSGEKASSLVCKAAHVPTLPYIPCVCVCMHICEYVCECVCACEHSLSFLHCH